MVAQTEQEALQVLPKVVSAMDPLILKSATPVGRDAIGEPGPEERV